MESTINQRIDDIISKSGMKLTAFAKKIGIAQTSLRDCVKNNSEPKFSTLNKIIIAEPLISAKWLLTGMGEMYERDNLIEVTSDNKTIDRLNDRIKELEIQLKYQKDMYNDLLSSAISSPVKIDKENGKVKSA